jgi:Xaa-Pro aminopeptidase
MTIRIPELDVIAAQSVNGFPRYTPVEMARRHALLGEMIGRHGLACVAVTGRGVVDNPLQYFTNWPGRHPSFLLFWPDGETELIARLWNHLPNAREIAAVDEVRYGGDTHAEALTRVAERLGRRGAAGGRVGLVGDFAHWDVAAWAAELSGVGFVDLNGEVRALRRVKSAEEMDYVRAAAALCDLALEALREGVRPGIEERQLQRIIEDAFLGTGAQPAVTFALSTPMSNPDVCVPRQNLSDRRIEAGDAIVTEISVVCWGYTSQILRSLTVGADPNELYGRLHRVALERYLAIATACRPGLRIGEILDLAEPVHEAGLTICDDLFHGYGGGGYLSPVVRTRRTGGADVPEDTRLEEGWVVVTQPNVITPDARAGVQVGNALLIGAGGAECLQHFPTELVRCG